MYLKPTFKKQNIPSIDSDEYRSAMIKIKKSHRMRVEFFSPNKIRKDANGDFEKVVELFTFRFYLFCKLYFLNDKSRPIPKLGDMHLILFRWFAEMVFTEFSEESSPIYAFLTHRLTLKTLFAQLFTIYTGVYSPSSGSRYCPWITYDSDKLNNDFRTIKEHMQNSVFKIDFPEPIRITDTTITFHTKHELQGFTIRKCRRGMQSLTGSRPDRFILDDALENDITIRYENIRNSVWKRFLGTLLYSAEQNGCPTMALGNWLHEDALSSRILSSASPNRGLVMGLFKDGEKMSDILWKENWSWEKEEGKISINERYEASKRQPGGEEMFRREMLCCPSTEEDRYFNVKLINKLNQARKPMSVRTFGEVDFHIFKQSRKLPKVTGTDTAFGVHMDSNTFTLFEMNEDEKFDLIASAENNQISQERFAEDCIEYMSRSIDEPKKVLNVIEANSGGGCIYVYDKNKFKLYERKDQAHHDFSVDITNLFGKKFRREHKHGLWRTPSNKSALHHALKEMLESGTIIIPDERILAEILSATNLDIAKSGIRRAKENIDFAESSSLSTNHLDFIASLVCSAWGMKKIIQDMQLSEMSGARERIDELKRRKKLEEYRLRHENMRV